MDLSHQTHAAQLVRSPVPFAFLCLSFSHTVKSPLWDSQQWRWTRRGEGTPGRTDTLWSLGDNSLYISNFYSIVLFCFSSSRCAESVCWVCTKHAWVCSRSRVCAKMVVSINLAVSRTAAFTGYCNLSHSLLKGHHFPVKVKSWVSDSVQLQIVFVSVALLSFI